MRKFLAAAAVAATIAIPSRTAVVPRPNPFAQFVETSTCKESCPTSSRHVTTRKPPEQRPSSSATVHQLRKYPELFAVAPDVDLDSETRFAAGIEYARERIGWVEQNQARIAAVFQRHAFAELNAIFGRPTADSVLEVARPLNDIVFFLAASPHADEKLRREMVRYIQMLNLPSEAAQGTIAAIKESAICVGLTNNQATTEPAVAEALELFEVTSLMTRCDR